MPLNFHEDLSRHFQVHGSSNRAFGVWFGLFFSVIAILPLRSGSPGRQWALAVAAGFFGLAVLRPAWLDRLNRFWSALGLLLGRVTNPVIMGLLFFLVITPTACLARWLGKDPLRLRRDPTASSYWITGDLSSQGPETMSRQF